MITVVHGMFCASIGEHSEHVMEGKQIVMPGWCEEMLLVVVHYDTLHRVKQLSHPRKKKTLKCKQEF